MRSIILTSDSPAARNLETICEDAGIDAKVHIGSVAGLSNAAREALLQRSEATLARVLDALLYVGFSEPFELRAALASLEQLNITISEYTLRAALRRAQGLGLPILAGDKGELCCEFSR
ncbi:MAG: hypothetical protein M5R40_16430 [Anaerolineae bacterium]|nr:hypothetical protein [Anaerolineae bacterium]